MKKLIEKFKKLPLLKKLLFGNIFLWLYPFIESMIVGASGFADLSIFAIVLLSIGGVIFAYLFIKGLVIPVGYWIYLGGKWVINLFKKKK